MTSATYNTNRVWGRRARGVPEQLAADPFSVRDFSREDGVGGWEGGGGGENRTMALTER